MTFRLKRGAAPRAWTIPRKGTKWVKRPAPGPHPQEQSVPLQIVLRDLLGVARSAREARILARQGSVRLDGRIVTDLDRGVGLMDTLSLAAPTDAHYRMVKNGRGKLVLVRIPSTEAGVKIGQVRRKHSLPSGRLAVTLHDGRNVRVAANVAYRVGDSLKIEVPGQKVVDHLKLAPGALAFVAGGSHVGQLARVDRVEVRNSSQPNLVHFAEGFSTTKEYVFVVGQKNPEVTIAEAIDR
jgi:small subunit ribosomal protein S4e